MKDIHKVCINKSPAKQNSSAVDVFVIIYAKFQKMYIKLARLGT